MNFLVRAMGVAAVAAAAASCGGGSASITGTTGGGNCTGGTFCMTALSFKPTSATVAVGAVVVWENDSGVTHNVVFDNPAAAGAVGTGSSGDIGTIDSGSQSRMFSTAGVFNFHCTIHAGMNGTLTVQ